MEIILLGILLVYQTLVMILDIKDMKKIMNTVITQEVRLKFYKESIVYGWIPVFIIFIFVFSTSLSLNDIGIRKISLGNNVWLNSIVFIISTLILIVLLYQMIMYLTSEKYRKELSDELDKKKQDGNQYDKITLNLFTPSTKKEKTLFFFVSLTAGICEEIVWRGCMLYLLSSIFPTFHMTVISIIACIFFGIFHCYQGVLGIIKTSVIAILFILLYITTGSLLIGIIIHFFFDFSSAFLQKE